MRNAENQQHQLLLPDHCAVYNVKYRRLQRGEGVWSNADTCGEGGRKTGHFSGRPLWTTP